MWSSFGETITFYKKSWNVITDSVAVGWPMIGSLSGRHDRVNCCDWILINPWFLIPKFDALGRLPRSYVSVDVQTAITINVTLCCLVIRQTFEVFERLARHFRCNSALTHHLAATSDMTFATISEVRKRISTRHYTVFYFMGVMLCHVGDKPCTLCTNAMHNFVLKPR